MARHETVELGPEVIIHYAEIEDFRGPRPEFFACGEKNTGGTHWTHIKKIVRCPLCKAAIAPASTRTEGR